MAGDVVQYVINLDSSTARLETFRKAFQSDTCAVERVPAIDGRTLNLALVADDQHCRRTMGRSIQAGEVGCFLSHRQALQTFLASDAEQAIIFEDDAIPMEAFCGILPDVVEFVRTNTDHVMAINLGPSDYKYSSILVEVSDHQIRCTHRFPMLATAILWTRQGAQRVLEENERVGLPWDNFLRVVFSGTNQCFSISPPLVRSSGAASDIEKRNYATHRSGQNRSNFYFLIKQKRMLAEKIRALIAALTWRFISQKVLDKSRR